MEKSPRGEFKEIKLLFSAIERKANDILKTFDDFDYEKFKDLFYNKKQNNNSEVFIDFENRIADLDNNKQVSTSSLTRSAFNSFRQFAFDKYKIKTLFYNQITPEFLSYYDKWMIDNGNSFTSISMYVRVLRKLYNEAIEEGKISKEKYPFGKKKYIIPNEKNTKEKLDVEQLKLIFSYIPESMTTEDRSRDFWIFSFLANGLNMADIANLKFSNIKANMIEIYRQKTKNTSRGNIQKLNIVITPQMQEIIEKWKNPKQNSDNYVFEIINDEMDAKRKRATVKQFIKTTNKYMKRIAEKLNIEANLTTYIARHSFAHMAKIMGYSYEFIQESMGHSDLRTTKEYLGSFNKDTKVDFANSLENMVK